MASSSGMAFETTAAFLTKMIETTQEAPENIGTALKTVAARFQELKEDVSGTADSEFDDLDYNKVDKALKSVGVSLKDTNGEFRNLDDVFLDLSKTWPTLTRNQQKYVATVSAGSRQQSRLIALLDDYDRTMELINTAYGSAGRSSEQFAKAQDTIEFKMNRLKNSWEQLRTGFFSSESYKGVIDSLNSIVTALGKLDLKDFAALGVVGLTLGKSVVSNFLKTTKESVGAISKTWRETLGKSIESLGNGDLLKGKIGKIYQKINKGNINSMKELIESRGGNGESATLLTQYAQLQDKQLELENRKNILVEERNRAIAQADEEHIAELNKQLNNLQEQTEEVKEAKRNTVFQARDASGLNTGDFIKLIQSEEFKGIGNQAEASAQKISRSAQIASGAISDVLSAALTTSLMTAIAGADLGEILVTAGVSALAAAIPSIIGQIIPVAVEALGAAAGPIGIAIGTAVAAGSVINAIVKKVERGKEAEMAARDAEISRLKDIEKANKALQSNQADNLKKINSVASERKTLENNQNRYNELINKPFRTTKEEEELDKIIDNFQNNYSDVIVSFDENTKKIDFNTVALENLTDALSDEEKYYRLTEKANMGMRAISAAGNIKVSNDNAKFLQDTLSGMTVHTLVYDASDNKIEGGKPIIIDYKDRTVDGNIVALTPKEYSENIMGGKDKANQILDAINNLAPKIKESVGLSSKDYTAESLSEWFANSKYYNENAEDSGLSSLGASIRKAAVDYGASDLYTGMKETLVDSAKDHYKTFELAGQQIGEELASDLAQGIKGTNVKGIIDSYSYSKDNQNNVRQALFNKDIGLLTELNNNKNLDQNQVKNALIALGFVDENFQLNLDQYADIFKDNKSFQSKYGELPTLFKQRLEQLGIDKDSASTKEKWNESVVPAISQVLSEYIAAVNGDFGELPQETIKKWEKELTKYTELQSKAGSLTKEEYQNQYNAIVNSITDNAVSGALNAANGVIGNIIGQTNTTTNANAAAYKEYEEKFKGFGIDNIGRLSQYAQKNILSTVENANLSDIKSGLFAKSLVSSYNGVSSAVQDVLSSINLIDSSYMELSINSDEHIRQIAEVGNKSIVEATQIYTNYINTAKQYLTKVITNADQVAVMKDQYNDHLSKLSENFETLISAQNEFAENGKLTSKTYFKMLEDGFGKYVKVTENGYELISDAAATAFKNQAMGPLAEIDNQIKANEELEKYVSRNINKKFKFTGAHSGEFQNLDINTLLKQYKENNTYYFDRLKEYGEEGEEVQNLIKQMSEVGATSVEDFIKKIQEGTIELNKLRPEVYIQGLQAMAKYEKEAADKIKDLTDKLKDLKKQLAEDQDALEKAKKARDEAYHGTENYLGNIDGLKNYTNALDQLNNTLEDSKDRFDKATTAEEAFAANRDYQQANFEKTATLLAENKVLDETIAELQNQLSTNYSQYTTFDATGRANINFDYRNMDANDAYKDTYKDLIERLDDTVSKKEQNIKEQKKIDEEELQRRKEVNKAFADLESSVIDILKEQAKEEVEETKKKYDALSEADNEYLDALSSAIEKQRKLREQQNQYDNLASQEKKLSLLRRDTSGSRQKEILQLESEVKDKRQNLLDTEIDNVVDSMKELYEKQKEARDAEVEYMEAAVENTKYFAEFAANIMSQWKTQEDMSAWYLENDSKAKDMTVNQTEVYLSEFEEKWNTVLKHNALAVDDFVKTTEEKEAAAQDIFEKIDEGLTGIGTTLYKITVEKVDEAQKEADKAYNSAVEKVEDTIKKIEEAEKALKAAEDSAVKFHKDAMDAMVEASKSALADVSTFATKALLDWSGVDTKNDGKVKAWLDERGALGEEITDSNGNKRTLLPANYYDALSEQGANMSSYAKKGGYEIVDVDSSGRQVVVSKYNTLEEANSARQGLLKSNRYSSNANLIVRESNGIYGEESKTTSGSYRYLPNGIATRWGIFYNAPNGPIQLNKTPYYDSQEASNELKKNADNYLYKHAYVKAYAQGGLVNYTGPAWVDGTRNRPEAFLNADDTKRIGAAAKLLSNIPLLNSSSITQNVPTTNIGDTTIEVHINVDNISSDYDVDSMIRRVKNEVVEIAKPIGTSVILRK